MSPHYLLSKWCADERHWWVAAPAHHGLATEGRIAIVRIWPTEEPWPTALADERGDPLIGFTFYDLKKLPPIPGPTNGPTLPAPREPFRDRALRIGRADLAAAYNRQGTGGGTAALKAEADRLTAASGQIIYLHGRRRMPRPGIARGGLRRKFIVPPSEPDPVERDPQRARDIKDRRVETLTGCDGLLLLGTDDGRALEADLLVVGRQDRQLARAHSKRLLPCAVLDTAGPGVARRIARRWRSRSGSIGSTPTRDLWPTRFSAG